MGRSEEISNLFSTRTYSLLIRFSIFTKQDIKNMDLTSFSKMKGVGPKTIKEIQAWMITN